MLLFRSEEDTARFCAEHGFHDGAVVELNRLWPLARRWYDDRMDLDWTRRTLTQRQAILEEIGLTGPFWRLG